MSRFSGHGCVGIRASLHLEGSRPRIESLNLALITNSILLAKKKRKSNLILEDFLISFSERKRKMFSGEPFLGTALERRDSGRVAVRRHQSPSDLRWPDNRQKASCWRGSRVLLLYWKSWRSLPIPSRCSPRRTLSSPDRWMEPTTIKSLQKSELSWAYRSISQRVRAFSLSWSKGRGGEREGEEEKQTVLTLGQEGNMSSVAAGALLPVTANKAAKESHNSQNIINKINYCFSFFSSTINQIHHRHHHRSSAEKNQETASTYSLSGAVMGISIKKRPKVSKFVASRHRRALLSESLQRLKLENSVLPLSVCVIFW